MDDVTKIIYECIRVCRKVHPDFDIPFGQISIIWNRHDFKDLWGAIGDLYKVFTYNRIPTKSISIDVDVDVTITIDYIGLKKLLAVYPSDDEEEYAEG